MSEFIFPPNNINNPNNPVVFLAGPVQGAEDWQKAAADMLLAQGAEASIISPRGAPELYQKPSAWLDNNKQNPWERHYLRLAREKGVLAMWMAEQTFETPGRAYAQTSRIEFGFIAGWKDYNPDLDFVFGVSDTYQGGNKTYMQEVCGEIGVPVHNSLGTWCAAILERLNS